MAQAYSKSAKRRNRKSRAPRGINAEFEQRWGDRKAPVEQDDPLRTVTEARQRQTGETDVSHPMMGEDAGRAIRALAGDEAEKLWQTFKVFDGADERYHRRILGKPRFPNLAKLEFMPERFETRPDDRPDLRSDEEKDRAAVSDWMRWQGHLGRLHAHEASSVKRAARQMDWLYDKGAPTSRGVLFVSSLRRLTYIVEGVDQGQDRK